MNKITNVNFKDNTMTFNIYTSMSIVNTNDIVLYVDGCLNVNNLYCDSADNHDYVLNYSNCEFTIKEIVREGEAKEVTTCYVYEVSATSEIISSFDDNIKYIKMFCTTEKYANDYVDGIYYNPNVLYDAEIKVLHNYCSTCLDDKQMQTIMLIVFKRQLLEQAIATSHNKEAMQSYLDLCKLLGVSIKKNSVDADCNKCINGVCRL